MRALTLIFLFLAVAGRGRAGGDYLPAVWGVEEGLPQHVVGAVLQTRDGDLWCGTYNGLARFDGVKFTVFDENSVPGLAGRGVAALYEDRQGVLWVGSDSGGLTMIVDRVPVRTPDFPARGQGSVLSMAEDAAGDLWVLWQDGTVARWRDGLRITPPPEVSLTEPSLRLVQEKGGRVWLTHRNGFSEVTPGGLIAAPAGFPQEGWSLQRAAASARGGIWVVAELKLRRWQDGKWVEDLGLCPWDPPGGTNYQFVSVLGELRDGRLLVGMVDGGAAIGQPGGGFRRYRRQEGLPNDWIRCATEDQEGNLWLGTGGGGLVALRPRRVQMLSVEPDQAQHNIPSLLAGRDGALWVATEGGGLFRRQDDAAAFIRQESLPTRYIWAVTEDHQHNIWAGMWGEGLAVLRGDGTFQRAPGWPAEADRVTVLRVTRDGTLWAGGWSALRRLTAQGWESQDAAGQPYAPPGQRCLTEDAEGGLWIGLTDGRMIHWRGNRQTIYDRRHGLPGDALVSVHAGAGGIVWLGTAGSGLLRFKDGRATAFTTAHGLPHNVISQILPGGDDNLWLGSYGGICRVSLTELEASAAGRLPHLNVLALRRADGMASMECTTGGSPGACVMHDGRLCFPTNRGLALINPADMVLNSRPPPVLMESLHADGLPVPLGTTPPLLGPGVSGVSLNYTALSFTAPERVRFRTWMEGLETGWQEAGVERTATYRYLAPGTYRFRVTACNNDGVWNETGAALAFTILPHFWQTGAFSVLLSLGAASGVGGLVWAATRRRNAARLASVERVHALERERARIARDIHDDLGSGLTRIMLLSQSARSEMPPGHPATAEMDNVCRAAEGLTRTMDEVVWAVDPRHDTLESLVAYVGSAAQELLQSARIRFRLEAPDRLPAWTLTADCRHSLFLACKEALHNIVRHAQARTARVIFQVGPTSFTLIIEDDGSGFDPAAVPPRATGGHGLANMQERLTEAGGTCTLTSQPGHGTRVTFRLPHPVS